MKAINVARVSTEEQREVNNKIARVLKKILAYYSLGRKYNYCLEYSVEGLIKNVHINNSELELILKHLEERKIVYASKSK